MLSYVHEGHGSHEIDEFMKVIEIMKAKKRHEAHECQEIKKIIKVRKARGSAGKRRSWYRSDTFNDRSRAAKKFKVRLEIAEKIDEEQKWKDPSARQIAAKSRIVLGSMSPTLAQHHDDDDHHNDGDCEEDIKYHDVGDLVMKMLRIMMVRTQSS